MSDEPTESKKPNKLKLEGVRSLLAGVIPYTIALAVMLVAIFMSVSDPSMASVKDFCVAALYAGAAAFIGGKGAEAFKHRPSA